MKPAKILPPEELSPRVVPRTAEQSAPEEAVRSAVHAAVIEWKRLVLAVWELDDDSQYTGELPAGLSSQQFWAKVKRAAGKMQRGELPRWLSREEFEKRYAGRGVGVAVRGRRWWTWTIQRGPERRANRDDQTKK